MYRHPEGDGPDGPRPQLPMMVRIEGFERRLPEIKISAPWANRSGKWEVSEPDRAAVAYDSGRQMMDDLEARYPDPGPRKKGAEPGPDAQAGQAAQMIKDWENGGSRTQIAASLARKILTGAILPYAGLPSNESLADEWDASVRTVIRAKALLAERGVLRKEAGVYWVT
jgi:Bacterial regulatory proteins, gntR family